MEQMDVIKRLVADNPASMEFVTTAQGNKGLATLIEMLKLLNLFKKLFMLFPGIQDAMNAGKVASLIGVESGHAIGDNIGILRMLYELGARYMTLTHTCNTPW